MYRDILALFILIVLTIPVSYRLNVSRSRAMVVVMGLIMTFGYMGGIRECILWNCSTLCNFIGGFILLYYKKTKIFSM